MDFLELASSRFSSRQFNDKMISEADLINILSAGRVAPTAKNNQPQKIYVLQSEESLVKINEVSPCIYGAKTVLMICADTNICWTSNDGKYDSAEMDSSIICTHMMLQAKNQGIDSCWVLCFDRDKAVELFNLPDNIKPYCLLPLGYTDEKVEPSERHFSRKSLAETVVRL